MKPFLYYGDNPQQFVPCDATMTVVETSVKLHPQAIAIRNKRKRARFVKRYHRIGIKFFLRPVWEIYPHTP